MCLQTVSLEGKIFPWGDDFMNDGTTKEKQVLANIYEGEFPYNPEPLDGMLTTAPVCSFKPNGYGLHNTVGNVWEWYYYLFCFALQE